MSDKKGEAREVNALIVKFYMTSEDEGEYKGQEDFIQDLSSEEREEDPNDPDYSEESENDSQVEEELLSLEYDENEDLEIHLMEELLKADIRAF